MKKVIAMLLAFAIVLVLAGGGRTQTPTEAVTEKPIETGLNYVSSRYDDPETCRFINAVVLLGANQDILSYNLVAYSSNDTVNMQEPTESGAVENAPGDSWVMATNNGKLVTFDGKTTTIITLTTETTATEPVKSPEPKSAEATAKKPVKNPDSKSAETTAKKPVKSTETKSAETTETKTGKSLDPKSVQKAFNKSKRGGDFDGAYGLQCVDLSNWFVKNYTTLKTTHGNGKDIAANLSSENGLPAPSSIPIALSVFSVKAGVRAFGA
ncbi:MAG: hypothetical protein GX800_09015, partial [Clostridiaceae bacterium]|nr:hypothetical protein [Clostridiaceae bacterium]